MFLELARPYDLDANWRHRVEKEYEAQRGWGGEWGFMVGRGGGGANFDPPGELTARPRFQTLKRGKRNT